MLLRFGRVSELEAATARVRVAFGAEDALVSYWLPVLQQKTLSDRVYWMPDLEEHVVCLLDEHGEDGVVIGSIYSEADAPPVTGLDRLHVAMKDGTTFDYDRAAHRFVISLGEGGDLVANVPAGRRVFIGGETGKRLATVEFVTQVFQKHTHPTPAGPSGVPVPLGIETVWPQVTDKGVSE